VENKQNQSTWYVHELQPALRANTTNPLDWFPCSFPV